MTESIPIVMIVPLILLLNGINMTKRVAVKPMPKDNSVQLFTNQGYITGGSMRSQEAWEFANRYCGSLYIRFGVIAMVVGLLLLLILPHHHLLPALIMGGQLIFAVLPLGLTEKAIEQNFDRQGNRK
jgi:uncharacterized membrane protein